MRDDDFAALTARHRRLQAELADTAAELRARLDRLDDGLARCMATLAASGSAVVASCPDCERLYWSDQAHDCPTPGGAPNDEPATGRVLTPEEARRVGVPVARYLGPVLVALALLGCETGDPVQCEVMRCDDTACVEGVGCLAAGLGDDGQVHQFGGGRSRCGQATRVEGEPDEHDHRRCARCWTDP